VQKNTDCKNMPVLANNSKAHCFNYLNVQKFFKYLKMLCWHLHAYAFSCALKFMKGYLQIHHYTVHVKIMQAAPPVLIITGLRGIIITRWKISSE
jgi:hypothetical protein